MASPLGRIRWILLRASLWFRVGPRMSDADRRRSAEIHLRALEAQAAAGQAARRAAQGERMIQSYRRAAEVMDRSREMRHRAGRSSH